MNVPVWRDAAALNRYVYGSARVEITRRRREWFEPIMESHVVLWWAPRGYRPTAEEAIARLAVQHAKGPTHEAFTFRKELPAPDAGVSTASIDFGDGCPATCA